MKSIKKPIVSIGSVFNETITHGSLTLILDPTFNPEYHRKQFGIVESDFKDLKEGEKVYFHYLTTSHNPEIPPNFYLIDYKMLYCVIRDSQIVVLNDYLLVDIIEEEFKHDGKIIIPDSLKKETVVNRGIVAHTNHPQLKKGDEILFPKNCAFVNNIEGRDYYVMENQDALVKVNSL